MNRSHAIGGTVVALVVVISLGSAFFLGVGPAPGGGDSGERLTDFPTATPATEGTAGGDAGERTAVSDTGERTAGSGSDETTTTETPPFFFTIDDVEECGRTCRNVTATLHNNQDQTATGVTVFTRVYAGEDNTAEDDIVWEGKEAVGSLAGGASHTTTERVELTLRESLRIEQHDGWVTIVTTVQTDDRTVTFRDSEQVA